MGTFELIPSREGLGVREPSKQEGLGSVVLLHNARWFTKVRWIVAAVFMAMGLAGHLIPGMMRSLGVIPPLRWSFALAGAIILANLVFRGLVGRLKEDAPRRAVEINLSLQIVGDMTLVTILVHLVGSTDTFIAFAYLFHIALACIFFPPRHSLLVTFLAAGLYLLCVTLEHSGIWPGGGIFDPLRVHVQDNTVSMLFAVSAVLVWFGVWSLVSTLSQAVRKRDQKLDAVNEQLRKAEQETNRQVLRTTHDLKAPFSGIESNIQVLRFQYWDEIPESVRTIIERIEVRAQTLSERIKQILVLGDLRSQISLEDRAVPLDLHAVIADVIEDLSEKAKARGISLDVRVSPATVPGNAKQLTMLFSNLVANAISYSHEGGRVEVSAREDAEAIHVSVSDHGIGIKEEGLPHIFEEYYRTEEAARFNSLSTGLGLAIVKETAANLGLGIKVSSELGKGTTFEVRVPKCTKSQIR
ncbi:MAG: HAMP domain-containing sensor histidine kinase [Candidatus Latescibacterota bacterium]